MKDLLEALAASLVDDPGRVRVRQRTEEAFVRLDLEVSPEDRGRIIGRNGKTADALRTLLDAVAKRHGKRCRLEILD
jgi:uncharacterized protein